MFYNRNYVSISEFAGKTLTKVDGGEGDESVTFEFSDGTKYDMYHEQDCCEHVYLQDIDGDLQRLVGHEILMAEEVEGDGGPLHTYTDSYTWTFYKIRTNLDSVTLRWYGSSNGYYSEGVSIVKL